MEENMDSKENLKEKNQELYTPIPIELPSVVGWKEVPLKESDERLVPMGPFSGNDYDRIFTSSIYFGEREDSPYSRDQLHGALVTTFAREDVAKQILEAERMLPEGLHLMINDLYRTLEVQGSLYENFLEKLKQLRPGLSEEELSEYTQKFVSIPSDNPDRPSPHNTGGSVDVVIYKLPPEVGGRAKQINERIAEIASSETQVDEVYKLEMERIGLIAQHAQMLNFGTNWDYGGAEAALNYFEKLAEERALTPEEEEVRQNRRLLYNVMIEAGFEPYADEWWHYNSKKSQMGARTAGLTLAEYGGMELTPENWHHELVRRQHLKGTEILQQAPVRQLDKLGRQTSWLELAAEGANIIGDTRKTSVPRAEVIEPPEEKAA